MDDVKITEMRQSIFDSIVVTGEARKKVEELHATFCKDIENYFLAILEGRASIELPFYQRCIYGMSDGDIKKQLSHTMRGVAHLLVGS